MDKRYQIFLSSTYTDLKDERQKVIQTLMEMDCIPSGMELFPAMDEEQFEFIKKVIDDCDYYLLIIGGRYGSTAAEGISYTEKEYDYAIEKGLKVIAFLHEEPDSIPVNKTDNDPTLRDKLAQFREKVGKGRLVKYWKEATELSGLVSLSLHKTIKTYPAVGWVRATSAASSDLLAEIHALRKENDELQKMQLSKKSTLPDIRNIAGMDEKIIIEGKYKTTYGGSRAWQYCTTWDYIFNAVAPMLLTRPNDASVKSYLKTHFLKYAQITNDRFNESLDEQVFQTIKVQLMAYDLVSIDYLATTGGGMGLFWSLTEKGKAMMMQLRVVRSANEVAT